MAEMIIRVVAPKHSTGSVSKMKMSSRLRIGKKSWVLLPVKASKVNTVSGSGNMVAMTDSEAITDMFFNSSLTWARVEVHNNLHSSSSHVVRTGSNQLHGFIWTVHSVEQVHVTNDDCAFTVAAGSGRRHYGS
jgi:hypothetical protein